jgi:protein-L-isoaspartate(D-aspartate) O-methyltransferase
MVERLHQHYQINDPKVLEAMRAIPRHFFVPEALQGRAYGDHALPISASQTISQPYIVARMTELLEVNKDSRVLEIGDLARGAQARIRELEIHNATVKCFDGTLGWAANAPYDGILVAAGGPHIPNPLVAQLKPGGRLVMPVGPTRESQRLVRVIKTETGSKEEDHGACAFVPLIGQHGWSDQK